MMVGGIDDNGYLTGMRELNETEDSDQKIRLRSSQYLK